MPAIFKSSIGQKMRGISLAGSSSSSPPADDFTSPDKALRRFLSGLDWVVYGNMMLWTVGEKDEEEKKSEKQKCCQVLLHMTAQNTARLPIC